MIEVVQIPIAAVMTQAESMVNDMDGRFKKRIQWAGETEKAELLVMDNLLKEGFRIVDVQTTSANNFTWLRYTLFKNLAPAYALPGQKEGDEQP
jgi:hypothetical protein